MHLNRIYDLLYNKGKVIVSAFGNDGHISYPAAFDSVIDVSSCDKCF